MISVDVKVGQTGNVLCLMLNKDAVSMLGVEKGDTLTLTQDDEGHVSVSHQSADFKKQMDSAKKFMLKYRDALRELAK